MDINIRDLSIPEYAVLSAEIREAMLFDTRLSADIDSLDALQNRLLDYIHLRCVIGHSTKLATLNRMFHRPAKRYAVSVSGLLGTMARNGMLRRFEHNGGMVLMSTRFYNETVELWDLMSDDQVTRDADLHRMLSTAK